MSTMRALYLPSFVSDPATLTPSTIRRPQPRRDECLVRVTHCSPQHADLLHAQGRHQNNNAKHGHVHPPFVLGYDFAGVLISLPEEGGRGVENGMGKERERERERNLLELGAMDAGEILEGWSTKGGRAQKGEKQMEARNGPKKGDRVFGQCIGAFSEYIAVSPERIRRVPDGLSNETACAMVGQAVSYAAVSNVAQVKPGETVLVSGASGGLGSVCCMVAKAIGAKVIALAGDEGKARLMRTSMGGAVDLILVTDEQAQWIKQIQSFTNGTGADVVLDNTGMVNDAIKCCAHFGRIVILGFAGRRGVMEDVKMNKLLLKDITIVGYRFGESGRRKPQELEAIWDGYLRMLADSRLEPVLHGRGHFDGGLDDMGKAMRLLGERRVVGKIVVPVAPEAEREGLAKL